MNTKTCSRTILLLLLCTVGCIVGDELTTFTIHPDGSADLIVFRSNLRSTEKGDRAEKELADYKVKFESQADDDFARIRDAGGKLEEAAWIRPQAPFSNFVRAHFPDGSALEKYWTIKDKDGNPLITTRFQREGKIRKLSIRITVPVDQAGSTAEAPADVAQLRQALANGISETRIAVSNGSITEARGFTVAGDRQSALLNGREIAEVLRVGQGKAELLLEWNVNE